MPEWAALFVLDRAVCVTCFRSFISGLTSADFLAAGVAAKAFSSCQNSGTCVQSERVFACTCFDGYTGTRCEIGTCARYDSNSSLMQADFGGTENWIYWTLPARLWQFRTWGYHVFMCDIWDTLLRLIGLIQICGICSVRSKQGMIGVNKLPSKISKIILYLIYIEPYK